MNDPYASVSQCIPEQVLPNPWQTRDHEDAGHIAGLAQSIAAETMLQIPVGRVNAENRVELAFGHSRLAAYKLLNRIAVLRTADGLDLTDYPGLATLLARSVGGYMTIDERSQWAYFPVVIRVLSDEEMFRLAVSENLARKDLDPMEEARAMSRYRDEFGRTSGEIGELFGLSDSAVRNKLRLLKLPARVQAALRAGELTEGQARALIPLYDLPDELRLTAEDSDELKPSDILEVALSGSSPAQVAGLVAKFMARLAPREGVQQLALSDAVAAPEAPAGVEEISLAEMPAPEPAPIPDLAPAVETVSIVSVPQGGASRETVEPEEEEEPGPDIGEKIAQSLAEEEREESAASPAVVPAAPAPKAAAAPVEAPKKLTWGESTIYLTLTAWPESEHGMPRRVMAGARINQEPPLMRMVGEKEIEMPEVLRDLLAELRASFFGGEQ